MNEIITASSKYTNHKNTISEINTIALKKQGLLCRDEFALNFASLRTPVDFAKNNERLAKAQRRLVESSIVAGTHFIMISFFGAVIPATSKRYQ
jgi:hypothetical protein